MPSWQTIFSRCQANDEGKVIGLYLCLVGGATARGGAAPFTAVGQNIAALRVGVGAHRAQRTAAVCGAVAGVDVHVQRI